MFRFSVIWATTPVQVKSLSGVDNVAAGWCHTAALKNEGSVWAWRYNDGRLGDNTSTVRKTPVQVRGQSGAGYLNLVVTKIRLTYSLSPKTYNGKAQGVTVTPKSGAGKVTVYYTGTNGTSYAKRRVSFLTGTDGLRCPFLRSVENRNGKLREGGKGLIPVHVD